MRILQYYPIALGGDFGTAISVRNWCESLANIGAEVTLVVDGDAMRTPCPGGVRCVPVAHVGRGRFLIPRLPSSMLDKQDVLVVHGGWTLYPVMAGWTANRLSLPFIATPHGAYHPLVLRRHAALKRAWRQCVEQRHLGRAFATHVFFSDERAHLEHLRAQGATIVVPNGVTTPPNVEWDGGSGGYLAWLGRFDLFSKGLDLVLNGLALLPPSRRPVVRLHGPDAGGGRAAVARLVAHLRLEKWVVIGGPLYGEDKWKLLARSVGFVFPSRYEAFSLAVGEAAGIGVPSLVTPFPLGRLLAEHDGAIICSATAEAVCVGLTTLLSPSARTIGRRGAEVIRQQLHWQQVARSWLDQMDALLGDSRKARNGHSTNPSERSP